MDTSFSHIVEKSIVQAWPGSGLAKMNALWARAASEEELARFSSVALEEFYPGSLKQLIDTWEAAPTKTRGRKPRADALTPPHAVSVFADKEWLANAAGRRMGVYVLVVRSDEGTEAAVALGVVSQSRTSPRTVGIHDLYVTPEWRRKGAGTTLANHLALCALQYSAGSAEAYDHILFILPNGRGHPGRGVLERLPTGSRPRQEELLVSDLGLDPAHFFATAYAPVPPRPLLGPALRRLRESRRLNQTELAFYTGVRRLHLNQIEGGHRGASIELLRTLAGVLELTSAEREELLAAAIGSPPMKTSRVPSTRLEELPWAFPLLCVGIAPELKDARVLERTKAALQWKSPRTYLLHDSADTHDLVEKLCREVGFVQVAQSVTVLAPKKDQHPCGFQGIVFHSPGGPILMLPTADGEWVEAPEGMGAAVERAAEHFREVFPLESSSLEEWRRAAERGTR
ncbi:MAG: GNAT family N-acetyltransferase [Myxococcota bacterium]